MINKFKTISICALASVLAVADASALSRNIGPFNLAISGYGTAGIIEPNFEKPDFLGDFRVRGQLTYDFGGREHMLGAVYMLDEDAVHEDNWWHEAFGFWQWRGVGRLEVGLTDSVAHKLGLGLPDVGGMRINHDSLIYRKMGTGGAVIANPEITNGSEALRVNLVAATNSRVQYGISVAGLNGDYDYEIDAGLKIKSSANKTKYAFSFGASFMEKPDDFSTDEYTPGTTADWRGQVYTGLNIQYNSWVFAMTGRVVYDEKPMGPVVDGLVAGAGLSYDILNYTMSLSYVFSDTGIWHKDIENYDDHTVVASFRYKYSKFIDGWTSIGMSRGEPFLAAGIRATF
ncbi:MAG: hypothetical protein J6S80_03615 [Alphaproteobacteria bacterium]|nr:hypothetical protein [Alphaproteobacteria bacterium]